VLKCKRQKNECTRTRETQAASGKNIYTLYFVIIYEDKKFMKGLLGRVEGYELK
jgi:hypothetical protein